MTTKSLLIGVLVLIVIGAGAWFALKPKPAAAPTVAETATAPTSTTTDASSGGTLSVGVNVGTSPVTVTYTDSGFSPANISISVGQTVTFVNNSSHGMWVASDAHPTHTEYDGTDTHTHCSNGAANNGTFDECSAVNPGGSFSYTFLKAGTHTFHNHVHASDTGTITVK